MTHSQKLCLVDLLKHKFDLNYGKLKQTSTQKIEATYLESIDETTENITMANCLITRWQRGVRIALGVV